MGKLMIKKRLRIGFIVVVIAYCIGLIIWYLQDSNIAVLNPAGTIAAKERNLMLVTVLLGLIVIIPVYVLTFLIAWRYREGSGKGTYQPELAGNTKAELVWWGIPTIIIVILSVITWNSSHALDPHQRISNAGEPLQVQVIAMEWKWLFIYPEQNIASVNLVQLPKNTPVEFSITADAPMNAFWIPRLGSQVYAMPGMSTKLNLLPTKSGDFEGLSSNISGKGFADMRFIARVSEPAAFRAWVGSAVSQPLSLTKTQYDSLDKPGLSEQRVYSSVDKDLYNTVIMKYMHPEGH
jgi:cytochrome o ubiquinol oxidase subunit II